MIVNSLQCIMICGCVINYLFGSSAVMCMYDDSVDFVLLFIVCISQEFYSICVYIYFNSNMYVCVKYILDMHLLDWMILFLLKKALTIWSRSNSSGKDTNLVFYVNFVSHWKLFCLSLLISSYIRIFS